MKNEIYRHWGNDKFIYSYFTPVSNREWGNKPHGGLYASPTKDVDISWDTWCKDNDFMVDRLEKHFDFRLKANARVLVIKNSNDVDKLPRTEKKDITEIERNWYIDLDPHIDYEKLAKDYDAIMVWIYRDTHISPEDYDWQGIYYKLYGWDVDSLLVLNPDIIEEV